MSFFVPNRDEIGRERRDHFLDERHIGLFNRLDHRVRTFDLHRPMRTRQRPFKRFLGFFAARIKTARSVNRGASRRRTRANRVLRPINLTWRFIAERDGRVVGSNFLWESDAIAGVGPITVDPTAQDDAIGRRLMIAILKRAANRKFAGVRLVQAAYHSRSLALYTKLGFDAREPLSVIQGPATKVFIPGRSVRIAANTDLGHCNALAARILGYDRSAELHRAINEGSAMVVEQAGHVSGYTTGIGFFGHAVAESNDDLKALIAAAPEIASPGFLLPTRNANVMRWCLEHGLRIVQPMTLMSVGEYVEPTGAWMPSIFH